jgi:hypothetical protein
MLLELGFDLQLLGSERYVCGKLEGLSAEQMSRLKDAFLRCSHPRFKREFATSRNQPFEKTSNYLAAIQNADAPKMAKLIKIVGMLLRQKSTCFGKKKAK